MRRFTRLLTDLGPGLLLAATGIGVGDMVSATVVGAKYGLVLVWALAVGVLLKFAITEGLARWQLATGTTLMEGWRDHLPPFILLIFFGYFLIWSYFVSSALVAASAMVPAAILPDSSQPMWGLLHALGAAVLVYWGTYQRFVQIMKFFVGLMISSLIIANILILHSGARWIPAQTSEVSLLYVLSVIGGVGGTVTLLSYGYWIREQHWEGVNRIGTVRSDLGVSFAIVFLFSFSLIFLSTQVGWEGDILEEGPQLCILLADRIAAETGPLGRIVFLLGFWGAAYSSVLGVWHGVPFLFDDWIHLWRRQKPKGHTGLPYRGFLIYMTLASISTLYLQRPVWLVIVYTLVGVLFFPFIISTLLWMNNSKARVGASLRNRWPGNTLLILSLLLFLYLGA
ncbi:Nramp family divalent metal transporter, partial [Acidobacteria bacterium AH-259-D05]|nr:Nramp family divalent metal transporter [Acidobacteria bacterium AH-259-D05]